MSRLTRQWLLVALAALAVTSHADESILTFDAEIAVAVDGSMVVTETIRVRAEGDRIRRGIFRDFPTDYRDRLGNRYRVGFEVLSVEREGTTEPYRTERVSNGMRVYVGRSDFLLPTGEHEYRLRYRTDRQLGFFDDHDELYWNVTGNGWDFQIENARARVTLPAGLPEGALAIEGYVGPFGGNERTYDAEVVSARSAAIRAARPLGPREGLTLVATWPKGLIDEPTAVDNATFLFRQNLGLFIAVLGFTATFGYLLYVWNRVGRDPAPGVIFPRYVPPAKSSPASVRYVSKMRYDMTALTAAIMNLAVKGYIEIYESDDEYSLKATSGGREPLAPGEQAVLDVLFAEDPTLVLDNKNHEVIAKAMRAHGKSLQRDYYRTHFLWNSTRIIPGVLVLGTTFGLALFTAELSLAATIVFIAGLVMLAVFLYLLRAPTQVGRRMLDEIEGFKQYLEVAEKDELALRNPPEKTPELFEAYLPYALALSVEQPWAEKFAAVLERLAADTGQAYHPVWYHGTWDGGRSGGIGRLTHMTSSVAGAISASATPPGSSSGAGGGGSSGGGGGGGGGGGW